MSDLSTTHIHKEKHGHNLTTVMGFAQNFIKSKEKGWEGKKNKVSLKLHGKNKACLVKNYKNSLVPGVVHT